MPAELAHVAVSVAVLVRVCGAGVVCFQFSEAFALVYAYAGLSIYRAICYD